MIKLPTTNCENRTIDEYISVEPKVCKETLLNSANILYSITATPDKHNADEIIDT
ncbi:MAG: hypothetical protein IJX99_06240 [Clostridia bacterium]|nr:hypothetical protein [Clostridia bacterium]